MKTYLVGAGIIGSGILLAVLLGVFAPAPKKSAPPPTAPLVNTASVDVRTGSLYVHGTGTVRPTEEITLTAEVAGRIVSTSKALVSGGRFDAGDVLAQIDPSDYRNAVRQAEAQVTQAEFAVLQAEEEVAVAREEYGRIKERTGRAPEPDSTNLGRLIFREPQLRRAEANLESARATLDDARTRLSRTRITVPFDGIVRSRQATRGSYVGPGTPIATVYATDAVEIVVSLPSSKAQLIDELWSANQQLSPSKLPATVSSDFGGQSFTWDGYVDRVEGAVDAQTRTIDVVVRVQNPYDPMPTVASQRSEGPGTKGRPPLSIGKFVSVDIQAQRDANYVVIPRNALRSREADASPVVWTVVGDTMLVERGVRPIQTVESTTYLAADPALSPGTSVITTDLRVYADSMRVRVQQ
ncbi:efflux transporter periplasmic adaptor subunit [Longibacter salinarum]|uniref:Efflux transporter periplasmic adaptor subunit n=1 Tax=Longibacter salinarum TaxID=1850348 RepID=A0A2A8CWY5_9BACT|nr:efflux RND transporter periplasmic adaptor subunit [Longibacter salinarum]PEN13133.1 efflux transporter periplasmic adaptor subunit [Longibacter salinarum]